MQHARKLSRWVRSLGRDVEASQEAGGLDVD